MEYRLLPEEMLLKLLKAGDKTAFKEIYNRYWKRLYNKAYLKTRTREVAEEIVQEIFVRLWEKKEQYAIIHLESYLNTAVKYQVINYFKSVLIKEKHLNNLKEVHTDKEDTAASTLLLHELNSVIDKVIHQLPHKTRLIFNLSRNENYSTKQISEKLHLSEKAVEYHITKSLATLRLYLKEIISLAIVFTSALFIS